MDNFGTCNFDGAKPYIINKNGVWVASCCWFGVWDSSATTNECGASDFSDKFEHGCGEDGCSYLGLGFCASNWGFGDDVVMWQGLPTRIHFTC